MVFCRGGGEKKCRLAYQRLATAGNGWQGLRFYELGMNRQSFVDFWFTLLGGCRISLQKK